MQEKEEVLKSAYKVIVKELRPFTALGGEASNLSLKRLCITLCLPETSYEDAIKLS